MQRQCYRCNVPMEIGYTSATGLYGYQDQKPHLVFFFPGEPTSANPIKAFQQGLESEKAPEAYLLHGYRCPTCGLVELVAEEKTPWMH
jgi:hypothetical protein